MLLMSTADTTAKHGHNHAARPEASPTSNGSFLTQMPLSILGSYLRRQAPSPSPVSPEANDADTTTDAPNAQAALKHAMTTPLDGSPNPSRPASSCSSVADDKSKKRAPRSKTSYLIAKPPQPVNPRSKLHIRPKVLLQLHQVIASQRPKPVYEVIPFSLLPQRSTRRLARTFNTRERLGPKDLLVVEAEEYSTKDDETRSDDERWGSGEVIGVISPGKCEKGVTGTTEICMNDGMSRWEVLNMPNGGYEFNTTDDHGLTLKSRWVLKPPHTRRVSGMSTSSPISPMFPAGQDDKKFTFSTISANSRRHPIIATMTRTRIDVHDTYAMPSATSPPTPNFPSAAQSPAMTPSSIDMHSFLDKTTLPIDTDDALRRFIVVSGIWVASQNFFSSDNNPSSPSVNTSSTFRPSNTRTTSMSLVDSPRSASPASIVEENRNPVAKMVRIGTERLPRCTSFSESTSSPTLTNTTTSPTAKTRSRRANSTGNTQLHSMTGSMRKRYGLAFEDQALPESEEERQSKRSAELQRIKELALSSPTGRPSLEPPINEEESKLRQADTSAAPLSAPLLSPPLLSPPLLDPERSRKTQSAFNPVTTTGLWDSGVTEGPGIGRRPTSMFVLNERKKKEEKKRERSKSKENRKEEKRRSIESRECLGLKSKSDWYKYKIKLSLKGLFRKDKN